MEIENKRLMKYLEDWDKFLGSKIDIIAIGGTALTLLGKKASTKDIDFCFLDEADQKRFIATLKRLGYASPSPAKITGHGTIIDVYSRGYIFCVQLEDDYFEKSTKVKEMKNITLYALSPIDLIISKTARLNERDFEDILTIFKNYKIDQKELLKRYEKTMKNSLVKDSKINFMALLGRLKSSGVKIEKGIDEEAERWDDG